MNMNTLSIEICDSPEEAPNYNLDPAFSAATITKAMVVAKGTVNDNPTVDIQFTDDDGKKYVAMITGGLIENLAAAIRGVKARR